MTTTLGSALADIIARGEDAWAIQEQARHVGGCEAPIRLRGRLELVDLATGELERVWDTAGLPDGVTHKRCNNRRASRCKPCSKLYQDDAWQLVLSGLVGGKGVPETVAEHPMAFVTLTAPSFGTVHSAGSGLCHARRDQQHDRCEHGRPVTCVKRHDERDPAVGRPLCEDCWDYAGAVVWNALASELWRRTTIQIRRELARLIGVSQRALRGLVSVQYVKVAEFQRRGLAHFHVLIRLDAAHAVAPPEGFTVELLAEAVRAAVTHVSVAYPRDIEAGQASPSGDSEGARSGLDGRSVSRSRLEAADPSGSPTPLPLVPPANGEIPGVPAHHRLPGISLRPRAPEVRWGAQLDVREVSADERPQVAGYLAKYATKHTEAAGGLDRPVKAADLAVLPVNRHAHRLIVAAWLLSIQTPELGGQRWAHQFGYGGHFLTKSRRYSTTFTALRNARAQHAARDDATTQVPEGRELVCSWQVAGIGWRLDGDAALAKAVREQHEVAREAAREARREEARVLALAG